MEPREIVQKVRKKTILAMASLSLMGLLIVVVGMRLDYFRGKQEIKAAITPWEEPSYYQVQMVLEVDLGEVKISLDSQGEWEKVALTVSQTSNQEGKVKVIRDERSFPLGRGKMIIKVPAQPSLSKVKATLESYIPTTRAGPQYHTIAEAELVLGTK